MALKLQTGKELVARNYPSRNFFLKPIVYPGSIGMVHAWTGVGKTFFVMWLWCAIAAKGNFVKWKAQRAARVLHVDTEMTGGSIQPRFEQICQFANFDVPDDKAVGFVTPDLYEPDLLVPNLASQDGQDEYFEAMKNYDLFVYDNFQTGVRKLPGEDEEKTIERINNFWRRLRAAGKSVIFVHHSGKGGTQLGSSTKEHLLNWTINLRRPIGYKMSDGAKFEVHFEKGRDLVGDDVEPFLCQMHSTETSVHWTYSDLVGAKKNLVYEMKELLTEQQIAKETGLSLFEIKKILRGDYNNGDEGVRAEQAREDAAILNGDYRHERSVGEDTDGAF